MAGQYPVFLHPSVLAIEYSCRYDFTYHLGGHLEDRFFLPPTLN